MRETGSHLFADLRGFLRVGSHAEIAQITLAEWFANVHRDVKAAPEPFRFPRPWADETTNEDVSAEQREELTKQLMKRSALRDR
ncbi:hypothetical protein K8F61_05155 [Microbacterium resistens]|uniref:Uncharacterized protein n=1 Tax=Microbacterium resistens TaxID=156977 RepID=A0ABY3RX97_9MICO|nr:hypothetical protein [Microbacterium resistens]UGS27578.1 hypothetical protein K8F61_05155 [Microbacterium resistens]